MLHIDLVNHIYLHYRAIDQCIDERNHLLLLRFEELDKMSKSRDDSNDKTIENTEWFESENLQLKKENVELQKEKVEVIRQDVDLKKSMQNMQRNIKELRPKEKN